MATSTGRRTYSAEFKAAAVDRHFEGEAVKAVAEDLGIAESTLRTWVLQAEVSYPGTPARVAAPAPVPASAPGAAAAEDGCIVCGRGPAVDLKIRSVVGIVIAFQWKHVKGRFCRDCGTASTRTVLNRTLLTGWWGFISFFFNWYAIAVDLGALQKLKGLPAPTGEPVQPPLQTGKPMWKRSGIYVAATALIVGSLFLVGYTTEADAEAFDGKCVTFDAGATEVLAVDSCSDSHDGRVIGVVTSRNDCPAATDGSFRLEAEDNKVLCVDLDQ
jgi:hypothetical protein